MVIEKTRFMGTIFLFVILSLGLISASELSNDIDNDGVLNLYDMCPNSMNWERIDKYGCDPFQFCNQFLCGRNCDYADFQENEQNKTYPNDCITMIIAKEGKYTPKCVPIGCKKQLAIPPMNITVRISRLYTNLTSLYRVNITGLPGNNSFYPIVNGRYSGWCTDQDHGITFNHNYKVRLYSSTDPNLNQSCPRCYDPDWDMVNYILNHKKGTLNDTQKAIHYFVDHGVYPPAGKAREMIDEALARGEGFWPQEGEFVAIIVDLGSRTQMFIIEVDP
jgi:hypothetical protein